MWSDLLREAFREAWKSSQDAGRWKERNGALASRKLRGKAEKWDYVILKFKIVQVLPLSFRTKVQVSTLASGMLHDLAPSFLSLQNHLLSLTGP